MPNAKAAEAAAALKARKAEAGGILASVPEPVAEVTIEEEAAALSAEALVVAGAVAETTDAEREAFLAVADAALLPPAVVEVVVPLEPDVDPDPPRVEFPPAVVAAEAAAAIKAVARELSLDEILAEVAELDAKVCREIPDDDVRHLMRSAVQDLRKGMAVARARGIWPTRTLTFMVAIDTAHTGRPQVFAGDQTSR